MSKVVFETENCTRCGGSGNYSFNQLDGSMCYKCRGSGKQPTKRGKAARKFAEDMLVVRIEDVPAGAIFSCDDGWGKVYRHCVVAEVSKARGEGFTDTYKVTTTNGTAVCSLGAGIEVRLNPTAEQIQQIADYQESLTKAGTPRKNR